MTQSILRVLSTLVLVWTLTGCNRTPPAQATATPPDSSPAAEASAADPAAAGSGSGAAVAQAGPPSETRYPLINFGLLTPEERQRFVTLGGAELCPCEGAVASLDACLQTEDVCMLALTTAEIGMRMIKESAGDLEIADAMSQHVLNARRVHTFDLSETPFKGAENATVTVVEFADFECPHCRELATTLHEVAERYGDRVRFYYKSFPLESHPNAMAAAIASRAAHRQGFFWQFHDLVYANQSALHAADDPSALFAAWAEQIGMNLERFEADRQDPALSAAVMAERQEGLAAGLAATPTLFINGVMVQEGYDAEGIAAQLDRALAAAATP